MATETRKTDEKRYDRQLRLWGEEGQQLLEDARLALLNATATGTETLKNLILPGIGQFTIIDGKTIDQLDVENNFFLTSDSIGKSRSEVAFTLLQELNPLSKGEANNKDPVSLIENDINYFKQFTIIIANNIPETSLLKLASFCWENKIPLVVEKSIGFIGYLRLAVPEHTIVEAKPDNAQDDLRLAEPFDDLSKYASSFDFDKMDSTDHSHTPFIIILLQGISKWKQEHDGKLPETRADKEAFKNMIIKGSRNAQEENFNEAYRSAHKSFNKTTIPSNTRNILNDKNAINIDGNSSKFWILASALKSFVENEGNGQLPLMGSISDMTSSTNGYIAIQKIYQDKAQADAAAVGARVKSILASIGKPVDFISADDIKKFCKNSLFITSIRYRSLEQEYNIETANKSLIQNEIENGIIPFYIALRSIDRFYTSNNRYPGSIPSSLAQDIDSTKSIASQLASDLSLSNLDMKHVEELVNYGGVELHTLASLLGGIASQEIIKLITHQYTPMDNTYIFNGLNSTSAVFSL